MGNAKERIWRTESGRLVAESEVGSQTDDTFGATLAFAEGDEMTDADDKAFKSGKPAPESTPPTGIGLSGVQPETRAVKTTGTIPVSNPVIPAKK